MAGSYYQKIKNVKNAGSGESEKEVYFSSSSNLPSIIKCEIPTWVNTHQISIFSLHSISCSISGAMYVIVPDITGTD